MLQIETFSDDAGPLSQSVTSRSDFAELLLQIETNRREHPLFVKTTTKVSMNCPPPAMLCVVVWAFVQIKPAKNLSLGGWRCLRIRVVKWHSRTWLLVDYGKLYFQIMACAALVVGDAPHVRRYGASRHRQPLQRVASR